MKKLLFILPFFFLIFSIHSFAANADYKDVNTSHWAYETIKSMREGSIIEGYPDGTFRPNETVSYGEFIKMAVLADKHEDIQNADKGHWALNYYYKAIERGYFTSNDISDQLLCSGIPRRDMALIISSILGDDPISDYDKAAQNITDVTPNTKHEYDIIKSYANGIITGYSDGTFKPDVTLIRSEAATVIQRLIDESKRILPGDESQVDTRVKTTEERLQGELINLIISSESKLPISDVVTELEFDGMLEKVKYYEIIDDYPGEMKLVTNMAGGTELAVEYKGGGAGGYLIKDKRLISMDHSSKTYYVSGDASSEFPTNFDYLGFANVWNYETMVLIPNPFK